MVQSSAATVTEYLAGLPPARRREIEAVRNTILSNLPEGYEESIQFGMIGYSVPLARYPRTYNKKPLSYAALAAQKNYLALYLTGVTAQPDGEQRFRDAWARAGKKLDMGKSCVRFQTAADLALEVVAETIAATSVEAFIAHYEASRDIASTAKS